MAEFVIINGNGDLEQLDIYGSNGTAEASVTINIASTIQTTSTLTSQATRSQSTTSTIQAQLTPLPIALDANLASYADLGTSTLTTSSVLRQRAIESASDATSVVTSNATTDKQIEAQFASQSTTQVTASKSVETTSNIQTQLTPLPIALDANLASYADLGTSTLTTSSVNRNRGVDTNIQTQLTTDVTASKIHPGESVIQTQLTTDVTASKIHPGESVIQIQLTFDQANTQQAVTADINTNLTSTPTNNRVRQTNTIIDTSSTVSGEIGTYNFLESQSQALLSATISASRNIGLSVISYGADLQTTIPLPSAGIYHSAFAKTNNTFAIATDYYGDIYKTTDGGLNWGPVNKPPTMPTTAGVRFCYVYDNNNFAIAFNDTIYYTIDGGMNWGEHQATGLAEHRMNYKSATELLYTDNSQIRSLNPTNGVLTSSGVNVSRAYRLWPLSLTEAFRSDTYIGTIDYTSDSGATFTTLFNGSGELGSMVIDDNKFVSVRYDNSIVVVDKTQLISQTFGLFAQTGSKFKYVDGRGDYFVVLSKGYQTASNTYPAEYVVSTDGGLTWNIEGQITNEVNTFSVSVGGNNHYFSTGTGNNDINLKHKEVLPYILLESDTTATGIVPFRVDSTIDSISTLSPTAKANYVESTTILTISVIDNTPTYRTQISANIDTNGTINNTPTYYTYLSSTIDTTLTSTISADVDKQLSSTLDINLTPDTRATRQAPVNTTINTQLTVMPQATRHTQVTAFPILTTGVVTANQATKYAAESTIQGQLTFVQPVLIGDLATESFAILTELATASANASLNIPVDSTIQTSAQLNTQWSSTLHTKATLLQTSTLNNRVNRHRPLDSQINTQLTIIKAEALTSLRAELQSQLTFDQTQADAVLDVSTFINTQSVNNQRNNRIRYVDSDIPTTSLTTGQLSTLRPTDAVIDTQLSRRYIYLTVGKALSATINTVSFQPQYYTADIEKAIETDINTNLTTNARLATNSDVSANIITISTFDAPRLDGQLSANAIIQSWSDLTANATLNALYNATIQTQSIFDVSITNIMYVDTDIQAQSTFDPITLNNAVTIESDISAQSTMSSTIQIESAVQARSDIDIQSDITADNTRDSYVASTITTQSSVTPDTNRYRYSDISIQTQAILTSIADDKTQVDSLIDTQSITDSDNNRIRYIDTTIINSTSSFGEAKKTSNLCAHIATNASGVLIGEITNTRGTQTAIDGISDMDISYGIVTSISADIAVVSGVSANNDVSLLVDGSIDCQSSITSANNRARHVIGGIDTGLSIDASIDKTTGICLRVEMDTDSFVVGRLSRQTVNDANINTTSVVSGEWTLYRLLDTTITTQSVGVILDPLTIRYIESTLSTNLTFHHITGRHLTISTDIDTISTMSQPMLFDLNDLATYRPDRDRIIRVWENDRRIIRVE